jgi:hypothetical protein
LQKPGAVEGLPAWSGSSWWYRAGLTLALCAMTLLLVGPILPWFHTKPSTARPDIFGVPPTSPLDALLSAPLGSLSGVLGIAVFYLFLALGASIVVIRTLAAAARHHVRRGEGGDAWVGALASLCGASLLGLFLVGLMSMNGKMPLDWTDSRFVLDTGYFATLAGFILAFVGNTLIAFARRRSERMALV